MTVSRKRRILLVNPNTSDLVTTRLRQAAEKVLPPNAELRCVTAEFGAEAIETPAELAIAAHATLQAIARNTDCDVAIVAAFGDPGLQEARQISPIPVLGMREAGLNSTGAGGRRFGVITVGPSLVPALNEAVRLAGLERQLIRVDLLDTGVIGLARNAEAFYKQISDAIEAQSADGAEAVLLGGAPFSGLSSHFSQTSRIAVHDGLSSALSEALQPDLPRRPSGQGMANSDKRYLGIDGSLARLLGGNPD